MNHRLIALLLALTLGLQSLVMLPAAVHAMDSQATAHCSDAGNAAMQHQDAGDSADCPCCLDAGMSTLGCASYCVIGVAVVPVPLVLAMDLGAEHLSSTPRPFLTRFDIPPTPPPIG